MREPEIIKAVLTAWTAVSGYQTLLPGGLHELEAEDSNTPEEATKWGLVKCEEGPLARMTNGGPIRQHTVSIEVKAMDGLTANASLMHSLGTIRNTITKAMDNGGYIIDMWPAPSKCGQTGDKRRMKTVSGLTVSWRVQSRWDY